MKVIYANNGKEIYVDDEDFDYLNSFNWTYDNGGYVITNVNNKPIRIHRMIFEMNNETIPHGLIVDHVDGNKLNNTKSNLRVCTQSNNQMNKSKTKRKTTSIYKGVYYDKYKNKWNATIEKTVDNKRKKYNLGYYSEEEFSARVYDINALELFGDYAKTNFPKEDYLVNDEFKEYIKINKPISKTSKYRYVSWSKVMNKWCVEMKHNKTKYRLGYYDNEVEAVLVANDFIKENHFNKIINEV